MIKIKSLLCVSLILSCCSISSIADPSADDVIKYRKHVMSAVGANVKGMVAMLKGHVPRDDESLSALADGFAAATRLSLTSKAFMQNTTGSGVEKTTSTAKVWNDWGDFNNALSKMEIASKEIQTLANTGKLTSFGQLKPVLKQCSYCHREAGFRKKK